MSWLEEQEKLKLEREAQIAKELKKKQEEDRQRKLDWEAQKVTDRKNFKKFLVETNAIKLAERIFTLLEDKPLISYEDNSFHCVYRRRKIKIFSSNNTFYVELISMYKKFDSSDNYDQEATTHISTTLDCLKIVPEEVWIDVFKWFCYYIHEVDLHLGYASDDFCEAEFSFDVREKILYPTLIGFNWNLSRKNMIWVDYRGEIIERQEMKKANVQKESRNSEMQQSRKELVTKASKMIPFLNLLCSLLVLGGAISWLFNSTGSTALIIGAIGLMIIFFIRIFNWLKSS